MSDTYADYLKLPELLSLQKRKAEPAQHDEMLFIVVHQVFELWFKEMLHEIGRVLELLRAGDARESRRLLRRVIEIQRVFIQQITVLETMSAGDFLKFRKSLGPASGFQSHQFREMEYASGMKDPKYLKLYAGQPSVVKQLEARLAGPSLPDEFFALLGRQGLDVAPDRRIGSILKLYADPKHYDLMQLAETCLEFDENFSLWRFHHVQMVERMIGGKRGTGQGQVQQSYGDMGMQGIDYLASTLSKRCFPELWQARTYLGSEETPAK